MVDMAWPLRAILRGRPGLVLDACVALERPCARAAGVTSVQASTEGRCQSGDMKLLLAVLPLLQAPTATSHSGGDDRVVRFEHPVTAALERAQKERRLLFLKPVYGGVDELGARSYCEGTW